LLESELLPPNQDFTPPTKPPLLSAAGAGAEGAEENQDLNVEPMPPPLLLAAAALPELPTPPPKLAAGVGVGGAIGLMGGIAVESLVMRMVSWTGADDIVFGLMSKLTLGASSRDTNSISSAWISAPLPPPNAGDDDRAGDPNFFWFASKPISSASMDPMSIVGPMSAATSISGKETPSSKIRMVEADILYLFSCGISF
jgi:hypothetical protein